MQPLAARQRFGPIATLAIEVLGFESRSEHLWLLRIMCLALSGQSSGSCVAAWKVAVWTSVGSPMVLYGSMIVGSVVVHKIGCMTLDDR